MWYAKKYEKIIDIGLYHFLYADLELLRIDSELVPFKVYYNDEFSKYNMVIDLWTYRDRQYYMDNFSESFLQIIGNCKKHRVKFIYIDTCGKFHDNLLHY